MAADIVKFYTTVASKLSQLEVRNGNLILLLIQNKSILIFMAIDLDIIVFKSLLLIQNGLLC